MKTTSPALRWEFMMSALDVSDLFSETTLFHARSSKGYFSPKSVKFSPSVRIRPVGAATIDQVCALEFRVGIAFC